MSETCLPGIFVATSRPTEAACSCYLVLNEAASRVMLLPLLTSFPKAKVPQQSSLRKAQHLTKCIVLGEVILLKCNPTKQPKIVLENTAACILQMTEKLPSPSKTFLKAKLCQTRLFSKKKKYVALNWSWQGYLSQKCAGHILFLHAFVNADGW